MRDIISQVKQVNIFSNVSFQLYLSWMHVIRYVKVVNMATKRRSIHSVSSGLNFRPTLNDSKQESRGTKPTISPTSVKEIFMLMVLYVCKKSLFFDTNLKVGIYLGALFLISLIADVATIPKTYLSRSDNAFNQYFVKFAWGWNLILVVPYIVLTSYVYCCGQIDRIIKHHITRVFIATFFWWMWTTVFNIVEANYGKCSFKSEQFNTKGACLKYGHYWNGFDVSGHSFILIYGSLVLIEETRSMINWDSIKEYIRIEEHCRSIKETEQRNNPLRNLSNVQLKTLQVNYEKYTPYIRGIFIIITAFQILWDIMLVSTMLYYHIMIEKFIGGAVAVLTWFFTYRFWYNSPRFLPKLPGEGVFKYFKDKQNSFVQQVNSRRRNSLINEKQPMFMGRPIYGYKVETEPLGQDNR